MNSMKTLNEQISKLKEENLRKERVESLKKKESEFKAPKKRVSPVDLSKIKLIPNDVEKSYTKLLDKYSNYFNDKINEYLFNNSKKLRSMDSNDLNKMINSMLDTKFTIDCYPSANNKSLLTPITNWLKKSNKNLPLTTDDVSVLYFDIFNTQGNGQTIVVPIGDFKISKASRKNRYFVGGKSGCSVLSLQDTLAFIHLIDKTQNILNSVLDELQEQESIEPVFVFASPYDRERVLSLENFNERKYKFSFPYYYNGACHLIVEAFSLLIEREYNAKLLDDYNKDLKSEYAKSFQDKKTITLKVKQIMTESYFNQYFNPFEIDQDTDLIKFKQVEQEFLKLKEHFDFKEIFKDNTPALRFRRLGQHKALGLYYPLYNCICVDITSPKSFFHEVGHCIDFTTEKSNITLSSKLNFANIIRTYRNLYNQSLDKLGDEPLGKYLKNKKSYFFTPTEIFARSFEIYLAKVKGIESSFLKAEFPLNGGYVVSDKYMKELTEYFNDLINKLDLNIPENISTLLIKEEINKLTIPLLNNIKEEKENLEVVDNEKMLIEEDSKELSIAPANPSKTSSQDTGFSKSSYSVKFVKLTTKKNKGQLSISFI
ncbi:LPD1 domain-containing protein [Clostridium perfringens]|uniref:LPD1 domain-containing protein n=2 Tax=Clostridium perfringens TaxID=1502 RepID=UPI002943A25F|nr:LPD1 domain-containing protein [Clostridium perfringens]